MDRPIQLREVFTPGGLPSVTYVSREHLKLEQALSEGLARGFSFIVVTGPTKSGKSVLSRRVLGNEKLVAVEGGQVRSESDFWDHVAYHLNIASAVSKSRGGTVSTSIGGEASGGIPGVIQGKGTTTQSETDQTTSTKNYTNVPMLASINRLLETKSTLMIDDFHYLEPSLQRNIIQSLKGAVFKGLSVVLLAVPHRAFDPIIVENEVEGRFKHIPIPSWALDDLLLIPRQGFPALNVSVERAIQRKMCEESFGNPLLVQEICTEFCLKNGVLAAQDNSRTLDDAQLVATYRATAESKGFPVYQKLKRGPEGRRPRRSREVRDGGKIDLYTAILDSVARLGPKTTTSLEDIRGSLREVFAENEQMPSRSEIIGGLVNMSGVAKKIQGEPPLEWVSDDQRLEIIDPFLLFCLKWSK
jgi:hypothetical protein